MAVLHCSSVLPNTATLKAIWSGPNGTKATNIFHVRGVSNPTNTDLAQLCTDLYGALNGSSSILPRVSHDWTLQQTEAHDNSGVTEDVVVDPLGAPGVVTSSAMPPNCCVVSSWRIPAHYRGGHPRTYWTGIPQADSSVSGSNVLSTSAQGLWRLATTTFLTSVNTSMAGRPFAGVLGCIAKQRTTAGVAACLVPPIFRAFSSGEVHSRIDSQRRRLGKEALFL